MRSSNQIELIANWTEVMEAPNFQDAISFVINQLPAILEQPERLRGKNWTPVPPELMPFRVVANHFESVGSFVRRGLIDAEVACDLWALIVVRAWDTGLPVLTYARSMTGTDALWENFEYLALMSKREIEARPKGNYPSDMPRLPKDTSLTDALAEHG